jgi:hypothetical protein
MIEQKLIVGRYLELDPQPPPNIGPPVNGFQEVARVVLHINESHSSSAPVAAFNPRPDFHPNFQQRVEIGAQRLGQQFQAAFHRQQMSTVTAGELTDARKVHRNFIWLPWLRGVVSEVQPGGMDVLTGPMSGCWIMSYLRNGVHYIGHVGTDETHGSANSIAARNAWNTFAAGVPMGAYSGFNPFNDNNPWPGPPLVPLPNELARKYFALVTAAGAFYTVVTYPQGAKRERVRIAGIQPSRSTLPQNGRI